MTSQQTKLISNSLKSISNYRKNHSLAETGVKFNLTAERVRQILLQKNRKYCKKHKRWYYNSCSHCLARQYKVLVELFDYSDFMREVRKESKNRKRDFLSVERRKYLVRRLYDKSGLSFFEIAKLLCRDYSTITHAYIQATK